MDIQGFADSGAAISPEPSPESSSSNVNGIIFGTFFGLMGVIVVAVGIAIFMAKKKKQTDDVIEN